jgi:acetoin utilization protein AcuB
MRVRHLMTPSPHTLSPGDTLGDAAGVMTRHGIRHVPIVENGRVVGLISDRDVKMALGPDAMTLDLARIDPRQAAGPVDWFMVDGVLTVHPDAQLADACRLFSATKVGALPVVDDHHLIGILSVIDLLDAAAPLFEAQDQAEPAM